MGDVRTFMKFTVENFGPIQEAENIEVKPMTVFVGPSNTGKSYMAMLIYASIKALLSRSENRAWRITRRDIRARSIKILSACDKSEKEEACQLIKECFKIWAEAISELWKDRVQYCFGEDGHDLIKGAIVKIADSSTTNIEINLTHYEGSKISNNILVLIYDNIRQLLNSDEISVELEYLRGLEEGRALHMLDFPMMEILYDQFLDTLHKQKPRKIENINKLHRHSGRKGSAYYLPAIRGGILQSHRTLVGALIGRAPLAAIKPFKQVPLFNGVLADFMQGLISINDQPGFRFHKHKSIRNRPGSHAEKIKNVAEEIEKEILSGKIEITESHETGYPDFQYSFKSNGNSENLSLMNASSTVSELASVVLFINNYLSPGSYFILEEPEAHLHPKAQREIAVMLAKLVKAGVNVLITTHSDIVCDQIGNFIYAEKSSDSKVENIPEESCATYIFEKSKNSNHGKTKVEPVPFDMEGGFATKDHLDVHSDLYNETVKLMEKQPNDND